VATFPLAYRRLMVSVVEHGQAGRQWPGRLVRGVLIGAAGRHPEVKAAADFYLTTLARVERHRFMMAMAAGSAVAWVVLGASMMEPPSGPEAAWLSLPLSAMISIYVPRVELWLTGHPYLAAVFVGQWLIAASAMRYAAARHVILPSYDEVDPAAGVLRLN